MRFWELSNKDVINCKNGHRLGCVGDLEIDVCKDVGVKRVCKNSLTSI